MSYTLKVEEFGSIGDFVTTTNARPLNQHWEGRGENSKDSDYEFRGTSSLTEAMDLLHNGWSEPLERMREAFDRAMRVKPIESRTRVRPSYNVSGSTPSVPRALIGLPKSMKRMVRVPVKSKTIYLSYDVSVSYVVQREEMTKCGIAVLELVTTLERLGYRVRLDMVAGFLFGNDALLPSINVKGYRDHLDVKKLAFPMAHPSMFRRLMFRWLETSPLTPYHDYGYGVSLPFASGAVERVREEYQKRQGWYFTIQDVREAGFDVERLMKNLDIAQEAERG